MARRVVTVALVLRDLTNQANTVMETRRLVFSGLGDRATIQAGVVLTAVKAMGNAEVAIGATLPVKGGGLKTIVMWRKRLGAMQAGEYVLIERGTPVSLQGM